MIALEVYRRGKRLCRAGVGSIGVLNAHVTWVGRAKNDPAGEKELFLSVGGLHSPTGEHRDWLEEPLSIGDEVMVRVVSLKRVDKPKSKRRDDPKKRQAAKEYYVRRVAAELGWKIDENPSSL